VANISPEPSPALKLIFGAALIPIMVAGLSSVVACVTIECVYITFYELYNFFLNALVNC